MRSKILGDRDIKELLYKGGLFFLIKAAGMVLSFLFLWFIARHYGAEANGLIAISFSIILIGAILPKMGYDINFVRLFPVNKANKKLFSKAMMFSLGLAGIMALAVLLLREQLALLFFGSADNVVYITYAACAIPLSVFIQVGSSVFRAEKRNAQFSFFMNASRFLFGLLILILLYFIFDRRSQEAPIVAYLTAMTITAGLVLFGIWPILNRKFSHGKSSGLRAFTKDSLPMMLSASIVVMMGWADTIILSIYEDQDIVGVYSIAVKLATLISFGLNSLNSILAPQIAKYYHEDEKPTYLKLIATVAKINFYFSIAAILFLAVFRHYVLAFFGPEFIIGATVLVVLCIGQMVNAICGPVGVILQMTGRQKVFKNFLILALLVNISLNFLLIPKFGMMGGALGTITALAVWNISSAVYIKRVLKINSFYIPLV